VKRNQLDRTFPQLVEMAESLARGRPAWQARFSRLLDDPRIHKIIPEIDSAIRTEDAWRALLFLVGFEGGWQPKESDVARRKRRARIAKLAMEVSGLMEGDEGCVDFRLMHFLALGVGIEPTKIALAKNDGDARISLIRDGDYDEWVRSPLVSTCLHALAKAIERDLSGEHVPLNFFDRPSWHNPFAPQAGRQNSPQIRLERALCDCFMRYSDSAHPELVATLVEVALGLDAVDPEDLARRWRKFESRSQGAARI
jgi:hypothetical protein